MKSFEAEFGMEGAAKARDEEQRYRDRADKIGDLTGAERAALSRIGTGDLSLESPEEVARRIDASNTGSLDDLRVSEKDLRRQGIEPGANPKPSRANEFSGSGKEFFAKNDQDPLLESDSMAEMRVQDPEMLARMAGLKRSKDSLQADIMNLEGQMAHQQDAVMRKAQKKVLEQFRRELEAIKRELDDLSKV